MFCWGGDLHQIIARQVCPNQVPQPSRRRADASALERHRHGEASSLAPVVERGLWCWMIFTQAKSMDCLGRFFMGFSGEFGPGEPIHWPKACPIGMKIFRHGTIWHDFAMKVMESHGKSWKVMESHGKSWKVMESHGGLWSSSIGSPTMVVGKYQVMVDLDDLGSPYDLGNLLLEGFKHFDMENLWRSSTSTVFRHLSWPLVLGGSPRKSQTLVGYAMAHLKMILDYFLLMIVCIYIYINIELLLLYIYICTYVTIIHNGCNFP